MTELNQSYLIYKKQLHMVQSVVRPCSDFESIVSASVAIFIVSFCIILKYCVSQWCLALCNPMVWSLPGSSVCGILQARTLEWVAIPFSRGSSQPRDQTRSPALQADSSPSEPPGKPQLLRKDIDTQVRKNWVLDLK